MFSTTGLFRSIPCPEGEACVIINCIFSHDLRPKDVEPKATTTASVKSTDTHDEKRRKISDSSKPLQVKAPPAAVLPPSVTSKDSAFKGPSVATRLETLTDRVQQKSQSKVLQTLKKTVSPPPLQNGAKPKVATTTTAPVKASMKPLIKESLNPRKIPYDPAGHSKRTLFLKHIHDALKRLNDEFMKGSHPDKEALSLSDEELIKAALDEEEATARGNSNVYANVIKNRLAAYKKMRTEDWVKHVLSTFPRANKSKPVAEFELLETGLPLDQEHLFLDHMISDQTPLAPHGYVPVPPTEEEMVEAQAAVAASLNFEVCDRCKSRFRVFPDRREEDGAFTTNGPCVHHPQRPVYPRREKTDAIKGARETVYGCCQEPLGTKGCTEFETHVFKINDAKRLGSVLPFIYTPENPNPAKAPNGKVPAAVTFDCEMGYTVCGFELMRLTAATWPQGDPLIDVLVRPQGAILDFNTRWSGITSEAYSSATPYGAQAELNSLLPPPPPGSEVPSVVAANNGGPLPIVDSPAAARDLLCSYITPSTPLIGHALENDLNVVRLCHPRIVDTVLLYPHPRGLPIRYGLKALTKQRLNRDIQMGGANGHDSLEDARASGELVRFAVKKKWEGLKAEGWTIESGLLMPPLPTDLPPLPPEETEPRVLGASAGVKRQRIQIPSGDAEESAAKRQNAGF